MIGRHEFESHHGRFLYLSFTILSKHLNFINSLYFPDLRNFCATFIDCREKGEQEGLGTGVMSA